MFTTRIQEILGWITGVTFTVAAMIGLSYVVEDYMPEREPASISTKPAFIREDGLRKQGKGSSVVFVELKSLGGTPAVAGRPFELEANIEARGDLDDLRYSWLLPEGVTLSTGSLDGTLASLKTGEHTTLTASFVSGSDENRQIHLHVYKMVNGEAQGQMAQFNSTEQEKIAERLSEKARFSSSHDSSEQQKVMQ